MTDQHPDQGASAPVPPDFRALCADLVDDLEDWIAYGDALAIEKSHNLIDRARAALAETEPEQEELEVLARVASKDQEIKYPSDLVLRQYCDDWFNSDPEREEVDPVELCRGAIKLFARWGSLAPQPVPVSERLPGPEDCDAEGRCWWLKQRANPDHDLLMPTWHLQRQGPAGTTFFRFTHWLPAHALPIPCGGGN